MIIMMIIYLLYILSTVVGTWHPEGHSPLIYGQPPFLPPLHNLFTKCWNSQLSNCCCRFLSRTMMSLGRCYGFYHPDLPPEAASGRGHHQTPLVVGCWHFNPSVRRYRYSFLSFLPGYILDCQYLNFISRKLTSVLLPYFSSLPEAPTHRLTRLALSYRNRRR